ncbi:MFS transporter [uncultured Cohaesibacter sp.]|uniref:MFS transporter n=1 Tax=uncultured Cohaesibacter sp. TaxID=1002546 RepID=UPI0029C8F419|nr:MFS transporter [uncultured Cohaesibacter sp.]
MQAPYQQNYAIRMSLFFAGFFFPFGIYVPFFGIWLKSLGFGPEEIGLVLTIPMIARVLFTPFMAAISDRIGDRRLALRIYCSFYGFSFALIMLNDSLTWIALVMALSHIAQSAIVPVGDSLALAGTRRFGLDYGRMRSSGTLAFLAANLAAGLFMQEFGANKLIWLLVLGNMLHILFSISLPIDPRRIDNKALTSGTRLDWDQLKQFGQSCFWVILIASSLLQASHSMLYSFSAIYWEKIGISANMTGILWSMASVAEIILFRYSKKISARVDWKALLMIAALVAIIRWATFPLELPTYGYVLLQFLHAGSFGCAHLGTMFFINEIVDDELSGTAQGIYTMLTGLLSALATMASGFLYAELEGAAFLSMSIIGLLAVVLLLASRWLPTPRIRVNI